MSTAGDKGGGYVIPSKDADTQQLPANITGRLDGVEGLTKTILTVVVISLAAMIVSIVLGVAALVMDQLRFNNELYRDGGYTHTNTVVKTETKVEQPVIFPNLKPGHQ